jgi:hypothetical protein
MLDALEQCYLTAKDSIGRSHWEMGWLLAQDLPSEQVAAVTGDTANWVRTIAQHEHQHDPAGLSDRRHWNPVGPRFYSAVPYAALASAPN